MLRIGAFLCQKLLGRNSKSESSDAPRRGDYSLHEVEQHFTELVAGVEDHAIFLLDPNGIVKSWNAGARRIKGYEAERDHRTAIYPLLQAGCNRPRLAARRTEACRRNWAVSRRRLAAAEGRVADLGERRHHRAANPARRASRLSENHARFDRTQAGGRDACAKAKSACG